jgi:hypothetical protein
MLDRFWRWLRTMPHGHWSWPTTVSRLAARSGGPAVVKALGFSTETFDELRIINYGPGDATEIVVTSLWRRPASGSETSDSGKVDNRSVARLPSLGAGSSYIVSLRPGDAQLEAEGPGRWLLLEWRDASGERGESSAFAPWDAPANKSLAESGARAGRDRSGHPDCDARGTDRDGRSHRALR